MRENVALLRGNPFSSLKSVSLHSFKNALKVVNLIFLNFEHFVDIFSCYYKNILQFLELAVLRILIMKINILKEYIIKNKLNVLFDKNLDS